MRGRDLDAFRLALDHVEHLPHLRHRAPHVVAHRGSYHRDRFAWSMCEGDFLATFETMPPPDVIFYDPFSAGVDPAMWSLAAFTRLFGYLTKAGFHVARGVASGLLLTNRGA